MVTLAVMSVLIVAMGAAVYVAGFALPTRTGPMEDARIGADVLEKMVGELSFATAILEHTNHSVTFVVPDRNGDGAAERIRYAWSGVAGEPLTRELNGVSATIFPDVQAFELAYRTQSVSRVVDGPAVEDTTERLLFESECTPAVEYSITSGAGFGQLVTPILPRTATHWQIRRIVVTGQAPLVGILQFMIYEADTDGLPTGSSLGSAAGLFTLLRSSLSLSVGSPPTLTADRSAAIVTAPGTQTGSRIMGTSTTGVGLLRTKNNGSTWTSDQGGLCMQVYGRIWRPMSQITVTSNYVDRVDIRLQGGRAATAARTSALIRNRPDFVSQFWDIDFSAPISDKNADAVPDLVPADGVSPLPELTGVFDGATPLVTNPDSPLSGPTELAMRMSQGGGAGQSAKVLANLERTASAAAPIAIYLTREADGSTLLRLFHSPKVYARQSGNAVTVVEPADLSTVTPLASVPGMNTKITDVRVTADTAARRISLFVDNRHIGTYAYAPVSLVSPAAKVWLGGDAGTEIADVQISTR
jgi:hypothetical protein